MTADRRLLALRIALVASAATAVTYLVVGFEWVRVAGVADVEPGPAIPLVVAAVAFAGLAILLAAHPGRFAYVAGAVLCAIVLAMYVVVAPSRDPSYEPWGLALKAIEAVLLVALGYLLEERRRHPARRA